MSPPADTNIQLSIDHESLGSRVDAPVALPKRHLGPWGLHRKTFKWMGSHVPYLSLCSYALISRSPHAKSAYLVQKQTSLQQKRSEPLPG